MPLTLYGAERSRAGRATWLLRELGTEFEHVESAPPASVNPNGKMPALVDGDFVLYESFAITQYLAAKFGAGTPLAPKDEEEAALFNQWSLWAITETEGLILGLLMGGADREETVEKLKRPLGALEESLAGGEYLVGGRFTVADLNVASIVANWGVRGAKLDLEEYPAVRAWAQRCGSRPAAKPPKKAKL